MVKVKKHFGSLGYRWVLVLLFFSLSLGTSSLSEAGIGSGRLMVIKNGTGSGSVISMPAGIDCGSTCVGVFPNQWVTLTATADPGSVFSGWSGAGTDIVPFPVTRSVFVDARFNIVVIATFTAETYDVTATVGGGNGDVSPAAQTVSHGQSASINITPDSGWHIDSITDNLVPVSIANPYIIYDVTADHDVVVTFEVDAFSYGDMSDYSSIPPFVQRGADANVLISLSVEWPMSGAAYNDQDNTPAPLNGDCNGRERVSGVDVGVCYSNAKVYLGYFDPDKCYTYSSGKFVPNGPTTNGHQCSGKWSGNLLNWATMTAIDEFRWALTGGDRVVDTTTETVLQRAYMPNIIGNHYSVFPIKAIGSAWNVAPSTVTPYSNSAIFIYNQYYIMDVGTTPGGAELANDLSVKVRVCDPSQGLEDNCVSYGSYFKPEGLIQRNDDRMRFGLTSYLLDSSSDRHGGVLRANMKYVGPYKPVPGGGILPNVGKKEYDVDGILIVNPESASEGNSGVINYLNEFGKNGYKSKDPVSELLYEGIRYYKNLGPTPEFAAGATSAMKEGFPIISSWEDPITDACQQNYIVGINDSNPWYDTRLPGNYLTSSTFCDNSGTCQTVPAEGEGEPTNADSAINVRVLTNAVGELDGLNGTDQVIGCTIENCDLNSTNLKLMPKLGEAFGTTSTGTGWNSFYVAGLAYYANTMDIRTEAEMPGRQTVTTFMVDVAEFSSQFRAGNTNMLWLTGKYGGFKEQDLLDTNSDGNPYEPNLPEEWDADGDGQPDNFVWASDPEKLVNGLQSAFSDILKGLSAGTAASVISNSRSGEGAIYQSLFYPSYTDSANREVNWMGEVHALLTDEYGNMREDTNGNRQLDVSGADRDLIVVFNDSSVYKIDDINGNGRLDPGTEFTDDGDGVFDADDLAALTAYEFNDLNYLWTSNTWLNDTSLDAVTQRSSYNANEHKRYIFTFIDGDGDMVSKSNGTEQIAFTTANKAAISPYLHPFTPFTYSPSSPPPGINSSDWSGFLDAQIQRIINYIRGEDQPQQTVGSSIIPKMRSRLIDFDDDGQAETFRLGDITHSTPTVVAAPAENYDLIYGDNTYATFSKTYKQRRNVLYVGANDGMFHAFNAGFYDPDQNKFWKNFDGTSYSDSGLDLGMELWAYVPFNLLSHLHWLTDNGYSHIYYVDLKPKIFDAKIFPADATHPGGWGTVLVGGMGLGGGKIRTDRDHDGIYNPGNDREMKSAFFILDITNPEVAPTVLAEITFDDLGYTTSYPTAFFYDPRNTASGNKWYLLLGSGPIGSNGPDNDALTDVDSIQNAKIYIIDLKELAQSRSLKNPKGNPLPVHGAFFTLPDALSYISSPIAVDLDLDYKTDVIYFGTVSGTSPNWAGKLRRIRINDNPDPDQWIGDSLLFDPGRPITASPAIARDAMNRFWVYFGTGRFENRLDISNTQLQFFFGIKEPCSGLCDDVSDFTWTTVNAANLLDVTNAVVYEGGDTVTGVSGATDFGQLESLVNGKAGWKIDFSVDAGERILGQAAVFGEVVTFSSYIPDEDPCSFQGESNLYAVHYKTGTGYISSIMGLNTANQDPFHPGQFEVLRKQSLGMGLASSPTLHSGMELGSKVFIQTSTGAIAMLEQTNPGITRSGRVSWRDE